MSDFSLTLVLQIKTSKIINDMAKVQIKSEKITPFGGIFHVRELFSRFAGPVIDKVLGLRCTSYGYQYSEIVGSLSSVYFCGGDCVEDVTSHLMPHLSLHPTLRTCSSDTILRGISELATANTTYTSETGKSYDFNTTSKLNSLLVKVLMNTGQLVAGESYDLDFDHQFIETEKYDAKMTYKKFTGYSPGVAVIGDLIVGIENRDGNANVRFHQQDTLERIFSNLESNDIHIKRARMDCGSCSREIVETIEKHSEHFYIRANRYELNSIITEKWEGKAYRLVIQRERRVDGDLDLWEGEYTYRCILTNDYTSTTREIVEFYNLRGGKERIFDDMNNGFGWARLPKSFMAENTVFLLLTALIRNFYKFIMDRLDTKAFGLKKTSRIKAFVFKFISVPAKWIRTARHNELNIYTDNTSYQDPFAITDD